MKSENQPVRPFTGRHMLAVMLAFFGVIIAVNVTMAVFANTSWTGFVVRNSYVAGLEFNRKAEEGRRQAELGWSSALAVADGRMRYALADREGEPVLLHGGEATFRRPVSDRDDTTVTLAPAGGALEAEVVLTDGAWIVEIVADAGLDLPYRETRRMVARGGVLR